MGSDYASMQGRPVYYDMWPYYRIYNMYSSPRTEGKMKKLSWHKLFTGGKGIGLG